MTILLFFGGRLDRYIVVLCFFLLGINNPTIAQIQISLVISSDELSDINRTFVKYIQEFNNVNTGTSVLLEVKDNYGQASDFFMSNVANGKTCGILLARCSETIELQESGTIMPTNIINKRLPGFMAQFTPRYTCCTTSIIDSKPYGIPLYRTTPVLYYNLNAIKTADPSLSSNNLPQTWQDLETLLSKLKKNYPTTAPMVLGGDYYEWIFETLVMQNGGNLFNSEGLPTFDSPEVIQTLKYWKHLADEKLIAPANSWKATPNLLINNKCAIIAYSSGANNILSGVNFSWEAAPIPGYKTRIHGLAGSNFYLSNNMNEAQLATALDFLTFIYSKKISTEIADITGLIDVTQDNRAGASSGSTAREGFYSNVKTKPNFMVKKYKKVRAILSGVIEGMFYNNIVPEKALKDAQAEALRQLYD